MLSIYLTQDLEGRIRGSNRVRLLYYFCDGQDEKRNTSVCILRGLIFQLVQQQPALVKILVADYRVQRDNLFKSHSLEALWRIFEQMIRQSALERVYCIIDGLDECDVTSLEHILKKIRTFFELKKLRTASTNPVSTSVAPTDGQPDQAPGAAGEASEKPSTESSSPDLRMIVVSREEPDCLTRELSPFPRVNLALDSNEEYQSDLKNFIESKAEEVCAGSNDPASTVATVSKALREGGDGSFLWVGLAVEKLRKSTSGRLSEDIGQLPLDIRGMYCQSLLQVPESWKYLVTAMLRWVVLAVRPLKLEELELAIGLSTGMTINRTTLKQILDFSGSLVAVREGEVSIVHQTIKDLLLNPNSPLMQDPRLGLFHIDEGFVQAELAHVCLAYLENGSLAKGALQVAAPQGSQNSAGDKKRIAQFPFLPYAVMNWMAHARRSNIGAVQFTSPFFAENASVRRVWWESYWISSRARTAWRWTAPTSFTLLHLAAYFGILPLACHLESQGLLPTQIAARDSHSIKPLYYAIQFVHFFR